MGSPLTIIHQNETTLLDNSIPNFRVNDFSQSSITSLSLETEWIAFIPQLKIDKKPIELSEPENFIPDKSNIGIIPFQKCELFPNILNMIPANIAVLIADPVWLGISVVHHSVLLNSLKSQSSNPIWNTFVQESFQLKPIEILNQKLDFSPKNQHPLPALAPDFPSEDLEWLRFQIMNKPTGKLLSKPDISIETIAARAGILQFHDELDASHQCSQSKEGEYLADHWHAIMHRREPDESNSKYWYRRVGSSPIFKSLSKFAETVLNNNSSPDSEKWKNRLTANSNWDSLAFVEMCFACQNSHDSELTQAAETIQYMEMLLLLKKSC